MQTISVVGQEAETAAREGYHAMEAAGIPFENGNNRKFPCFFRNKILL